jgi:V/A-type H+-transporting ATPase subunit C
LAVRDVSAYSVVHAVVRGLYSKKLSPDTWEALLQAEDLEIVLSLLSKTAYGAYLEGIPPDRMTPRRAVYQIRQRLADVYEKVIRLSPDRARELLLWLWRLYEVDDLKATFRGIEAGATWDRVRFLLYPRHKYALLALGDLEEMVLTGSVAEAIESISGTPYHEPLSHALNRYQVEGNLFPLEVALDLAYTRSLWETLGRLHGQDHEHAMRLVGTLVDMDNLLWAIRYRIYHHLSEQEIINYTLPFGYQVEDDDIRAIAAGADIASVVRGLYPDLADLAALEHMEVGGTAQLESLEVALQRRLVRMCYDEFVGPPFHIGIPIAYLLVSEYENHDLVVLIEAKASHLSRERFAPLLVTRSAVYSAR